MYYLAYIQERKMLQIIARYLIVWHVIAQYFDFMIISFLLLTYINYGQLCFIFRFFYSIHVRPLISSLTIYCYTILILQLLVNPFSLISTLKFSEIIPPRQILQTNFFISYKLENNELPYFGVSPPFFRNEFWYEGEVL